MFQRFHSNPLFSPADLMPSGPGLEVMCAFNPAATLFKGRRLLVVRVAERAIAEPGCIATPIYDPTENAITRRNFHLDDPKLSIVDARTFLYDGHIYLTSLSHFRAVWSDDGETFVMDERPLLMPHGPYEEFGVEDARISCIEGIFHINYTAVSRHGVVTALARTADFKSFDRLGTIFGPDNKDVVLFHERVNGRYAAYHRPAVKHAGRLSIWFASSPNLLDWGRHEVVIGPRDGQWDGDRVGAGASPIRTDEGWLLLYHGADRDNHYCLGALLLDLERPWEVLARSIVPL